MPSPTDWLSAMLTLPWELAGRLALAAILGAVVGGEREYHGHTAGLRTNILVALGACLFTILSIYGFYGGELQGDPARLAAQIVSGIGFLGAAAVFRDGDRVRGLTTAATIWLVAAIGMTAGTGRFFLALVATALTVVVLVVLRPVSERLAQQGGNES